MSTTLPSNGSISVVCKGNTWNYIYGQAIHNHRGILKEYIYQDLLISLQKTPYPGNWLDRKLLVLMEAAVNIHVCKYPKIVKLGITDWSFLSCVGLLYTLILLHILISSFLLQCPLENFCLQEFEEILRLLQSKCIL